MRKAKVVGQGDARQRLLAHYEAKITETAAKLDKLERDFANTPSQRNMPGSLTRLRNILNDTTRKATELREALSG